MPAITNYKLTIPKPCTEAWEGMAPNTEGRFCNACQKTVTDFTGMTDAEISNLLINADKKVCGRFRQDQLQPKTFIPQIPLSVLLGQTSFRKIFLLALFITMGTTLFSCKGHNDDSMMLGEPAIEMPSQQVPAGDTVKQGSKDAVIGKVEDADPTQWVPPPPVQSYKPPENIVKEITFKHDTLKK